MRVVCGRRALWIPYGFWYNMQSGDFHSKFTGYWDIWYLSNSKYKLNGEFATAAVGHESYTCVKDAHVQSRT